MNKPRQFNSVEVQGDFVLKKGVGGEGSSKKIEEECKWMQAVKSNPILSHFVPFCCTNIKGEMMVERIKHRTIAELYTLNDFPLSYINRKIEQLFEVLVKFNLAAQSYEGDRNVDLIFDGLYAVKTKQRVDELKSKLSTVFAAFEKNMLSFCFNGDIISGRDVANIFDFIFYKLNSLKDGVVFSVMHGDFCFSNIFENLVCIDPRGYIPTKCGERIETIYGDQRYDVAKLRHSVVGLYDYVKSNKFELWGSVGVNGVKTDTLKVYEPKGYEDICRFFDMQVEKNGFDLDEIMFIEALLFITMVPLHGDEPAQQEALFIIGLKKMKDCMKGCYRFMKKLKHESEMQGPLRVCFDLDGVICAVKRKEDRYEDCVPNMEIIDLMRQLKKDGHTIIINTARGMGSSGQNAGQANAKTAKITLDWLSKWGIPYDEIYFGKPNAHITIDDRCLRYDMAKGIKKEDILCRAKER